MSKHAKGGAPAATRTSHTLRVCYQSVERYVVLHNDFSVDEVRTALAIAFTLTDAQAARITGAWSGRKIAPSPVFCSEIVRTDGPFPKAQQRR